MDLSDLSVREYLDRLASAAPTPGGGAAAGLTAAQAAALLSMAANLSHGDEHGAVTEQLREIAAFAHASRERLLELAVNDARAFEDLMAAMKLPRMSEADKRERKSRIQTGLLAAARVPLDIMKETTRLVQPASILTSIGNRNLVSDVGVALHLMEAAVQGARLNVLINARQMTDRALAARTLDETSVVLEQFQREKRPCLIALEAAMSGTANDGFAIP